MCRRPPSRESGSMRSDSATWRGTVSRHDRSITVRDRSTAGMPRYSERASRISGSPSDPAASRREMKAEPPGFPSSAARRAASSSRPRETRTRPSCSIASPSATKGSYHGSGGEQVVLAFGISATGEIGADLLAGPRGAHGADDERFAGRSQGVGREDVEAPGHSLVWRDIDEAPRPEAAGLEGAREALPGRAGTPQIEKPAPEGTAGEVMGAKLDHPAGSVGGAGTGETRGRIPPPEEHLRHLAEPVSRLEEAELEVPVLGPRLVPEAAHGFDRGAAEGHARVHEWRLAARRRRRARPVGSRRSCGPARARSARRQDTSSTANRRLDRVALHERSLACPRPHRWQRKAARRGRGLQGRAGEVEMGSPP